MVRRLIITALLAVAVVGIVVAFSGARRPSLQQTSVVRQVMPPSGDLDLRQVSVGVTLAAGYTGDLFVDGAHLFVVLVFLARPEETTETVLAAARNDVDVEVGDALADAVVHGHERPIRPHRLLHGPGQALSIDEQLAGEGRR